MELFSYDFVQRGIISGILIGLSCAIVGVFLILKRLAFLGAGLSHAAFGGIALSFLIGVDHFLFTALFTVIVANVVQFLTRNKKVSGDTAIAVIFSSGMALAVLILGITKGFGQNLFSYLFGNILMVTEEELYYILIVFLITLGFVVYFYKKLLLLTFSEEIAKVKGVKVSFLNYSFISITALVVVASIKAVGVILSSSLIVIPAMSGILISTSFFTSILFSSIFSVISIISGLILSFIYDLPPSGAIVGISIILFLFSFLFKHFSLK